MLYWPQDIFAAMETFSLLKEALWDPFYTCPLSFYSLCFAKAPIRNANN